MSAQQSSDQQGSGQKALHADPGSSSVCVISSVNINGANPTASTASTATSVAGASLSRPTSNDATALKPPKGPSSATHAHGETNGHQEQHNNVQQQGQHSPGLRNSKGWDGKLRLEKPNNSTASSLPPSDGELSDEEQQQQQQQQQSHPPHTRQVQVLEGENIKPDEDLLEDEDPDTDEIFLTHSRIGSILALNLGRFKRCERLGLRQNSITSIEGLDVLSDTLKDLDLYDNLISHIGGLETLTKLTNLDLSFNKIKHIKHINHLSQLTDLFLVANKISHIENLEGLEKLRNLELGSNRIREIQNLQCLQQLEELWLAKNKITSLEGLHGLPNLRLLSIQSNRIRDLAPLAAIPNLEELYVSHNGLESLEGLRCNTKLRTLDISNNYVKSLAGLQGAVELEELWASYNKLSDFRDLDKCLADKKHLTTVYFEGNPLQSNGPAVYRNKVRLSLPQISQIDATFVKV